MSTLRTVEGAAIAPGYRRHLYAVPAPQEPLTPSAAVYARRRFAFALFVVLAISVAVLAGRAMATGSGASSAPTVTVVSGETLSEIAVRELPAAPVDQAVVAIQEANNLSSFHIEPGQKLVIPVD